MQTEAEEAGVILRGEQAVLLYAGTCPRCRFISAFLVKLAFGSLARLPLDHEAAQDFHRRHPEARGYPVLVDGERQYHGLRLLARLPRVVLRSWWRRLPRPAANPLPNLDRYPVGALSPPAPRPPE